MPLKLAFVEALRISFIFDQDELKERWEESVLLKNPTETHHGDGWKKKTHICMLPTRDVPPSNVLGFVSTSDCFIAYN